MKCPVSTLKQPDPNLLVVPYRELIGLEERLAAEGKRWSTCAVKHGAYHMRTYTVNPERLAELKETA